MTEDLHVSSETKDIKGDGLKAHWSGVFAMTLCVFALISSEFLPVSLLTPIASSLHISEGQAGQAIAVSGAFAVVTSLFLSSLIGRINRKLVLLGLTGFMILSGIMVAVAPDYWFFMIGRAIIGIVIGGFWSLSAAIAMRLVPKAKISKALAIFNSGNALAVVIAPPVGSFLGTIIGWRGAFFCVVPIAVIVFFWQWASLPSLEAEEKPDAGEIISILHNPLIALGMVSVGLLFMGQFSLFTYVRPFLENITKVSPIGLSLILFGIGCAGFAGTSLIGFLLETYLYQTLIIIPFLMAVIACVLIVSGHFIAMVMLLMMVWGFISTAAPVAWWTWLARSLPQQAEAGGGLMVALIQSAITLGAVTGGFLFDHSGYQVTFGFSAFLLILATLLAFITSRIMSKKTIKHKKV